jgi:hypothetical protein
VKVPIQNLALLFRDFKSHPSHQKNKEIQAKGIERWLSACGA